MIITLFDRTPHRSTMSGSINQYQMIAPTLTAGRWMTNTVHGATMWKNQAQPRIGILSMLLVHKPKHLIGGHISTVLVLRLFNLVNPYCRTHWSSPYQPVNNRGSSQTVYDKSHLKLIKNDNVGKFDIIPVYIQ